MNPERAEEVSNRWISTKYSEGEYNRSLMLLGLEFRKYRLNMFLLNTKALKIQHSFFGVKAKTRRIACIPKKVAYKNYSSSTMSSSQRFSSTSKTAIQNYKTSKPRGSTMYKKQEVDKNERQRKLVDARKKYSNLSRLTARNKDSKKLSTSNPHRTTNRSKASLVKKVTITDAELQNVVGKAWANVEKKKLNKTVQPKKKLRTQESIDEEKLLNNIVSQAWKDADKMKKKKEVAKKKAPKKPSFSKKTFRTQESINQEKLFNQINMAEVWKKAEEMKKETAKMRTKAQKKKEAPKYHSQQSIMEEVAVQNIVNKAWKDVNEEGGKENLGNIKENDMDEESSFEASDMEEEPQILSPSLKPTAIKTNQGGLSPQVPQSTRRTRASRKSQKKSSEKDIHANSHNSMEKYLEPKSIISSVSKENGNLEAFVPEIDPNDESLMTTPVKENMDALVEPSPEVY